MSERLFGEDVVYHQRFLKSAEFYDGKIDGIWGSKTDAAYNAFLEASDKTAAELGRFDHRTERNLELLQLPAQHAARLFMSVVTKSGIEARIISGTRSYEEQNALFRQGRFGNPGPRVTGARGGQSWHNFGIAWDIGVFEGGEYMTTPEPYERAAKVGMNEALTWGGDWKSFQDRPHYQLALPLKISEIRSRFEAGEPYF